MTRSINAADVKLIIFACEAGMGSSLMSVNSLKKKLKKADVTGVNVVHKPAREVPADAQLVVIHKGLSKVARRKSSAAVIVTFNHFISDPIFDKLVNAFVEGVDIQDMVGDLQ